MRALARVAAIVGALAVATLEPASVAVAETFTVKSCGDAPANLNNAWVSTVTDYVTMQSSAACEEGGTRGGLAVAERLGVGANADAGDAAWWGLTAPDGSRIVRLDIDRMGQILLDQDWRPEVRADLAVLETCMFAAGTDSCRFGALGGNARRAFQGLSATSVSIGGRCV